MLGERDDGAIRMVRHPCSPARLQARRAALASRASSSSRRHLMFLELDVLERHLHRAPPAWSWKAMMPSSGIFVELVVHRRLAVDLDRHVLADALDASSR